MNLPKAKLPKGRAALKVYRGGIHALLWLWNARNSEPSVPLEVKDLAVRSPLRLLDRYAHSGFSSETFGLLPFSFSRRPVDALPLDFGGGCGPGARPRHRPPQQLRTAPRLLLPPWLATRLARPRSRGPERSRCGSEWREAWRFLWGSKGASPLASPCRGSRVAWPQRVN